MKIALQIILAAFMVLYFGGAVGATQEKEKHFYFTAALLLAITLATTIAVL
ncbi:MAG: hypothetical protein LUD19_03595 [Clostridia bacterium]|nr:hypothetical protein [Clostridia bacterium]